MNTTKLEIAINRLHTLPVATTGATAKRKLTFLAELASMGYRVSNPELFDDSILANYDAIIFTLKEMRGGNVNYVPLFQGFPNEVPDDDEYFAKRVFGYVYQFIGRFTEGTLLDNYVFIPNWLFDLKTFGADPITQMQDAKLYAKGVKRQNDREQDAHTEWITLTFASEKETDEKLKGFLQKNLFAKSSIKEALKADIEFLLLEFPPNFLDPKKVVFKETRAYVMDFCWTTENFDALRAYIDTPTDILRMFAANTDTDISLATTMKFPKLNRGKRKFILACLENASNLAEDLARYEGLWLALGRGLHPGEFKKRFPKTYAAFDALRNGKIVTFNGLVELALKKRNISDLVDLLSQRPGEFARRIHHLLEISGRRSDFVLEAFAEVADRVALKNLLVLDAYFRTIESSDYRTVINKKGKIRVMVNKKHRLTGKVQKGLLAIIRGVIIAKISAEKSSWLGKKVWLDDALGKYTVPLQQRKASDGLMNIGRGTRIKIDTRKVLRLFVYWKQAERTTDLDISLVKFDRNMNYCGHVSYTNLAANGIQHSGDLQSAPYGAAEFIDVDLSTVKKEANVRYIASQVYRYCGDYFGIMDCHAGWMIRDRVNADYKTFDIKTVQNKFDLTGTAAYAIPILVDLWENEIVFVDLYMSGLGSHNTIEGAVNDVSIVTRQMARMIETRPNLEDLAAYHVAARGAAIATSKSDADLTIGIENCDLNVTEIETVLSELL